MPIVAHTADTGVTALATLQINKPTLTDPAMYLVAIAWMYVVVMMAVVEATSANGTVLGAMVTFVLYGALPLSIVLYILRTPGRKRARLAAQASVAETGAAVPSMTEPDGRDHAPGDPVTAERKKA